MISTLFFYRYKTSTIIFDSKSVRENIDALLRNSVLSIAQNVDS